MIHDSNISASAKRYLREQDYWCSKYQLRGFQYGMVVSGFVFFLFPVVRRQTFLRRFMAASIPMAYFLRWGYVWGHENWWRRVKEVTVTYELFIGTRDKCRTK